MSSMTETEQKGAAVPLAPCPPPIDDQQDHDDQTQTRPGRALMLGAVMLLCGTLCTVATKILFNVRSEGLEHCKHGGPSGDLCAFSKPWFSVLLMKIAMSFCIFVHLGSKAGARRQAAPGEEPAEASTATILRIAFPSFLDLLNVVLSNIGLVWVSSSIYQMTRGSVVVFCAIMTVRMLRKRLLSYQYWAVGMVTLAVVLVGIAGICANGAGTATLAEVIVGLLLILVSQVVLAYQTIVEERMMTLEHVTPFQIAGYEGLFGLVIMAVFVPVLTFTPGGSGPLVPTYHEDFRDSVVKIMHSKTLVLWSLIYCVVIALYNVSGQAVTKYLSAVVRSILEACRTLGVWVADLVLFYGLRMKDDGEAWTMYSWLELAGFCLLVYGTMSYKGLVPIPCAPVSRNAEPPVIPCQNSHPPSQTGSWLA